MQMEGSYVLTVVLTGISVVFLGLILLIFFVWLMGKIFDAIKSNSKKEAETKTAVPETKAAPAMEVEDGISDEIVAVIAAAVAAMSDSYTVKSVRKSTAKSSRRTAWGIQGVNESTKVF